MNLDILNEKYINEFKRKINELNTSEMNVSVSWWSDYSKSLNDGNNQLDDSTLYFVLTKMPSTSYGDATLQAIIVSCLCEQKAMSYVYSLLEQYQNKSVNEKYFIENVMINENYFTPSVDSNYLPINVNYGVEISMQGTIAFTENASDIEKLEVFNQEVKYLNVYESVTITPLSQHLGDINDDIDMMAKTLNQNALYKMDIKLINNSTLELCNIAREIKDGKASINTKMPVKIYYSDGLENEREMVIISIGKNSGLGESPTLTLTLTDAYEDIEE